MRAEDCYEVMDIYKPRWVSTCGDYLFYDRIFFLERHIFFGHYTDQAHFEVFRYFECAESDKIMFEAIQVCFHVDFACQVCMNSGLSVSPAPLDCQNYPHHNVRRIQDSRGAHRDHN